MSVPPPPEFLDIWTDKPPPPDPGSIRVLRPGETYTPMSGKYSRPPFTDPQPRRCDRCGRAWMCFWMVVVWILALVACIIWGPNP